MTSTGRLLCTLEDCWRKQSEIWRCYYQVHWTRKTDFSQLLQRPRSGKVKHSVDTEDLGTKDVYNPALVLKPFSFPMLCSYCQDKTAFWFKEIVPKPSCSTSSYLAVLNSSFACRVLGAVDCEHDGISPLEKGYRNKLSKATEGNRCATAPVNSGMCL